MIYCPTCEAGCSEKADVCPKCGHPLAAPGDDKIISLVTLRTSKPYIIATVILGLLAIGSYVYVNAPRDSRQRPSEAQIPYLDSPLAPRARTADGLGLSLSDFQGILSSRKGWGWSRQPAPQRGRVAYRGTNESIPDITCIVAGPEQDMDKFSVLLTIDRRDLDNDNHLLHLLTPIELVSRVLYCDGQELAAFVGSSLKDFIVAKVPIDRHKTIDGLDITASWVPAEGGLVFVLVADAVPPVSP